MGDYTKLQLTEAQAIADMYGIGQIKKLQSLSLGISNSNYKVECDQETYLLKVSNDKTIEQLHNEQQVLLALITLANLD